MEVCNKNQGTVILVFYEPLNAAAHVMVNCGRVSNEGCEYYTIGTINRVTVGLCTMRDRCRAKFPGTVCGVNSTRQDI